MLVPGHSYMNHINNIILLSRKLVDQMEADKHMDQPELLEVQLLKAILDYDQHMNWDNPAIVDDDGEV